MAIRKKHPLKQQKQQPLAGSADAQITKGQETAEKPALTFPIVGIGASAEEIRLKLHELEVYQIELEMQNEESQRDGGRDAEDGAATHR